MKTVVYLGLLLWLFPVAATAGLMEVGLKLGIGSWPDAVSGLLFVALYLGFVGLGAYIFTHIRTD